MVDGVMKIPAANITNLTIDHFLEFQDKEVHWVRIHSIESISGVKKTINGTDVVTALSYTEKPWYVLAAYSGSYGAEYPVDTSHSVVFTGQ